MSQKIAFALFLFGCALLALVNAERPYPMPSHYNIRQYQGQSTRRAGVRILNVPDAPKAESGQCYCPCNGGVSGGDGNSNSNEYPDVDQYPGVSASTQDPNEISAYVKIHSG